MSLNQNSIWVVITNSNTCEIYHYSKKPSELNLIKQIQHPENKLKNSELTSDQPGRFKTAGPAYETYSPTSNPKDIKIDNFSREIAQELNHMRNTNAFKDLLIIAAPPMKGLLFQHMDKNLKNLIIKTIEKDIMHLKDHELLDFLKIHTKFPNEK